MTHQDIVELLLVEDNPADAELAMRSLQKGNLANHIVWVRDGEEALEFIFASGTFSGRNLRNGPRVILLDLKLPKIDGLEVLRKIRTDDKTKAIPVVVLTSSHEEKDIVESYHLGANSYVVKPVDFQQFAGAMQQLGLYWLLLNKAPVI